MELFKCMLYLNYFHYVIMMNLQGYREAIKSTMIEEFKEVLKNKEDLDILFK